MSGQLPSARIDASTALTRFSLTGGFSKSCITRRRMISRSGLANATTVVTDGSLARLTGVDCAQYKGSTRKVIAKILLGRIARCHRWNNIDRKIINLQG